MGFQFTPATDLTAREMKGAHMEPINPTLATVLRDAVLGDDLASAHLIKGDCAFIYGRATLTCDCGCQGTVGSAPFSVRIMRDGQANIMLKRRDTEILVGATNELLESLPLLEMGMKRVGTNTRRMH